MFGSSHCRNLDVNGTLTHLYRWLCRAYIETEIFLFAVHLSLGTLSLNNCKYKIHIIVFVVLNSEKYGNYFRLSGSWYYSYNAHQYSGNHTEHVFRSPSACFPILFVNSAPLKIASSDQFTSSCIKTGERRIIRLDELNRLARQ